MHLPEITSHSTGGGPLSYVLLPEGGGRGGRGGGVERRMPWYMEGA